MRGRGLAKYTFAKRNTDIQYHGGGHRWLSLPVTNHCCDYSSGGSNKTTCRKKVAQTGLTKILGIRTEFPQSALKSAVGLWNTTHIPRNAWMTAARAALSRSQRRCGRRKVSSSSSCIAARLAIHALSCARRAWRGLQRLLDGRKRREVA
jgi:hypothetical protein